MEPKIYSALNAITAEIGAIGKNSRNTQQNFNFRGIDDVMNTLHPLLAKHRVVIVPEVLDELHEDWTTAKGGIIHSTKLKIRYTFFAEDGSNVSAVVVGEGMDSGDKGSNKALAIGYKYACFQVFCIPTKEMIDPDGECFEAQERVAKPKEQAKAKPNKAIPDNVQAALDYSIDGKKLSQIYKEYPEEFRKLSENGNDQCKQACAIINEFVKESRK